MTLTEKQELAIKTYDLGIKMAETFAKDRTNKDCMILAIMACISQLTNSTYTTMPIGNVTAEVLKAMRIEKNYTLRQVEDATGISNSYLSQLETGKVNNPSHDVIVKLTNFYNKGIPISKCCGRCIEGIDTCINND